MTLAGPRTSPGPAGVRVVETYGKLPLGFEENRGQTDRRVRFVSHGVNSTLFLTRGKVILATAGTALHISLVGASPSTTPEGLNPLPGKTNYFFSSERYTDIPNYARVRYRQVWPGIDVVFYGNQQQLEYDVIVAPGADPSRVNFRFEGMQSLRVDELGDLVIGVEGGEVVQYRPRVYQEINGRRREIKAHYVVGHDGNVRFAIASYDGQRPLIIDPVLSYSTFIGAGSVCLGGCIHVDSAGNAYISGSGGVDIHLNAFPITPGAYQTQATAGYFVSKLNSTGTALIYSTWFDFGTANGLYAEIQSIAPDSQGNVYIGGDSYGVLPTTPGVIQPTFNGVDTGFIAKLNAAGNALLFCTYLGGSDGITAVEVVTVDANDNLYAGASTKATDYITTDGAYRRAIIGPGSTAVTKMNPTGTALFYSTYVGAASITALAVDSSGNLYLTGGTSDPTYPITPGALRSAIAPGGTDIVSDGYVTKLNAAGSALAYSTFLGGTQSSFISNPFNGGNSYTITNPSGIAVDSAGNAYVAGSTTTPDFPLTAGAAQSTYKGENDAFVAKLNPAGSALLYSTFLGGNATDLAWAVATDSAGNAYVTGRTKSSDFPIAPGPLLPVFDGTSGTDMNTFVAKINTAASGPASLVYSTYLDKGEGRGIVADAAGNAYVAGETYSATFPTTPGAFKTVNTNVSSNTSATMSFVTKLADGVPCTYSLSALDANGHNWPSAGGSGGMISISTAGTCAWPVSSPVSWVTITSAASGKGNSTVNYSVAANTGSTSRMANLNIAFNTYTITQAAFSCGFSLTPPGQPIGVSGGPISVNVSGNSACAWTAVSNANWITVQSGSSGAGNGMVSLNVASTSSAGRFGTVTIAGLLFRVSQGTVTPLSRDFAGSGRSGAILYDSTRGQEFTALSKGDGTYQYVGNLFTPGFDTLRTGDFNGDGKTDLVVYNSQTALAYIGMSNSDGTFSFQSLFWSPGYDFVEAGDLNGDGKTDFALYNSPTGTLYTAISNGDGTFTYKYHLVSKGFTFVRLADFTGDGKADLFLYRATDGQAFLGVGDGAGGFTFNPLFVSPGYNLVDSGDVNGDGKTDIILYNGTSGNAATGISDGAGGFSFTSMLFSPGFTAVKLADFTGDGKADITVYNKNNAAAYFGTGTGAGNFNFQSLFWSPGYDSAIAQDVNGDGKADVVLYNSPTGTEYTGISNGNGTFAYTYQYWGIGKMLAR